ncbi:MAG: type II toxin-antitoxin system VapC family toxin [Pirellulales bacterium]
MTRILLDTNALLRASLKSHESYAPTDAAIAALKSTGNELCLCPQVLYEFWGVCTRPSNKNGIGMSAPDTHALIETFIDSYFTFYDDEPGILAVWKRLASYDVKGKPAHDAPLDAAMVHHRIDAILTFNTADFSRYREIRTIDPLSIGST